MLHSVKNGYNISMSIKIPYTRRYELREKYSLLVREKGQREPKIYQE